MYSEMLLSSVLRLLFPSFNYTYSSSLPGPAYIQEALSALHEQGINAESVSTSSVTFFVPTRKVLGALGIGKYLIRIERVSDEGYLFEVKFITLKRVFYLIASVLSILIVLRVIHVSEFSGLAIIPIVFLSGHLLFFGVLPSKVRRIQNYLLSFGD